jgi:hypothetical protein
MLLWSGGSLAAAAPIEPVGEVRLGGSLSHADQLSGAALCGGLLAVCPDEGVRLNVLARRANDRFDALPAIALLQDEENEIDMEGVASDGRFVYVVGSHSLARKKLDAEQPYQENRRRLEDVKDERSRHKVFRLRLADNGRCTEARSISLTAILDQDPVLHRFTKLPSKENGIDIEGVAAADGRLYFGFRGPVLRDNYVPVVALRFDDPSRYELLFLDLKGRGIRDLAAVEDGLLVLGGPVGDGEGTYQLYFWDKKDCLPGRRAPSGTITRLGSIEAKGDAKPEGLAVLEQSAESVTLILICDGAGDGRADLLRLKIPR